MRTQRQIQKFRNYLRKCPNALLTAWWLSKYEKAVLDVTADAYDELIQIEYEQDLRRLILEKRRIFAPL